LKALIDVPTDRSSMVILTSLPPLVELRFEERLGTDAVRNPDVWYESSQNGRETQRKDVGAAVYLHLNAMKRA
jgi:hypothetical protein